MAEQSLKEKTAKGLFWGGLSNGIQQLLNLFFGIFLARILNAEDYGMVGMLTIFSAIAAVLQEGGFISALTNRKDTTHKDYNAVFWFSTLCSITLYIILFLSAPYIADFYNIPELTPLARYSFLGFIIASLSIAPRALLFMLPQKGAQEMRDAVDSGKQLSDFAKGDRVKILAVNFPNHAEYVGQVGTVSRTVKRSNLVYIDLDNGGSYGSFPANIDFEKTREQTIEAAPTIRELYDYYKPIVFDALLKDTAYLNACRNSDRETAYLEGAAAIKRAINGADDLQLTKLYYDVSEFHNRLHREVLNETYPLLSETPYQVTQEDIDDVLREWNGDIESKRRVVRYMQDHAREKETAAWLAREYGQGYEDAGPFFITVTSLAGMPPTEPVKLTWAKMQRRIAQLIREDQFFFD